jgi:hypothetical protein
MSTTINLTGFAGANLAEHPRHLPETVGVSIIDAEPGHTDLRGLKARVTVATVPTSPQRKTIYRLGRDAISDTNYWLSWSTVVHAIRGFDGDDTSERTYFTGSGTPKWTNNIIGLAGGAPYPQGTRELAVPAPTTAPQIAMNTDGPTGTASTNFYVTTFVNDLGWESAPSPVSAGLLMKPGAIVDIGNTIALEAAPAGSYEINRRRIYRTQTGASGSAEFFFLREVTIGTTATTDDARTLGALMEVGGWIPPPSDGHSLIALWGGMTSMLAGKRILYSEPNKPYTYPEKYDITTLDTPLAQAKWGEQNQLVLTTGQPVLCQGTSPEGMDDSPLALSQPLASVRGVVAFGHGVAWPSNEGLAYAGSSGQANLTLGVLTPAQWKAMVPSTMVAGRYGRFYVCSYTDGAGRKGFMLDPLNPSGIWYLSAGFDACWYDDLADQLFVLEGGNVRKFDAGEQLVAKFTSKRFMQTTPRNFSVAKVIATTFPVTLIITARCIDKDGALRVRTETRTVLNDLSFTLKDGFTADDWQIEVQAPESVQAVRLAMDVRDLKGM